MIILAEIWTIVLWLWANAVSVGSLAALAALWWYWSRLAMAGVPVIALIVSSALLGGLGWGEQRYLDGREAGAAVERDEWERSFRHLQDEMKSDKRKAENKILEIAEYASRRNYERDQFREAARISNERLFQVLNQDPKRTTMKCEKADEIVECPACRSCYPQRVDGRILRNIATARGQD